jgi:hypothetical protein
MFDCRESWLALPPGRQRNDQLATSRNNGRRRLLVECEKSRHMSPALIFDEFRRRTISLKAAAVAAVT